MFLVSPTFAFFSGHIFFRVKFLKMSLTSVNRPEFIPSFSVKVEALQEKDEAKRKELYEQIQQILAEEVPCVYIQSLSKFYGLTENVEGFTIYPIDMLNLKAISFS